MDTPTKPKKIDYWSIFKLKDTFKDEADCIKHVESILWKDGAYCPYCGNEKIYRFKCGKRYKCSVCKQIFSIRVGTIFEDSNLKLMVWLHAIYLISINKRGISSHNLARQLGVTQKTGWFILMRLRHAMERHNIRQPILDGVAEADEVFIGGIEKHRKNHIEKYVVKHKKKLKLPPVDEAKDFFDNKITVVGIISHTGTVVAKVVPNRNKKVIDSFVRENLKPGATIYSDEWYGYQDLKNEYVHDTVNHSIGQYVKYGTNTTTNKIENVFKNLRQSLEGCYNWVSHEHTQRYLEEFCFRFSNRLVDEKDKFNFLISGCDAGCLPYKRLKAGVKPKQIKVLQKFLKMAA